MEKKETLETMETLVNIENDAEDLFVDAIEYEESGVAKYLEEERKKKIAYLEKYGDIIGFFETKVNLMFNMETVMFSVGAFKKKQSIPHLFTMLSFNHMPAKIVLSHFFRNSIKTTLNRQKSLEHIETLANMDYQESIYDMAPLIFAIMNKRVKNEVDSNYKYQYLYNSDGDDDFMENDKYMIYTLDGQHRLSTIYKCVENSNGSGFLKNKYIDFKFILVNSVEEYNTIFYAVNNSLPQKITEEGYDKCKIDLLDFANKLNTHFANIYKSKYNKKSNKMMISENENIKNPRPPCIHIEKIKGCNKLLDLLRKYGNDEIIKKMIKLNEEYSKKDITFFGYDCNYTSRDYNNVIDYAFYLGFHKNQPMKWVDDLV
jgi:hypothetical protein